MEAQNVLGITLGRRQATVLRARQKGQQLQVLAAFAVTVPPEAEDPIGSLAREVAQQCAQRKLKAGHVAVALESDLFMQHQVHSEFQQIKQIAATVRFDTEEVIATDISQQAVAFEVVSDESKGSRLNVYTAEHEVLSALILGLQSGGLDPLVIAPDAVALGHALALPEPVAEGVTLVGVLGPRHGVFLCQQPDGRTLPVRSFVLPAGGAHETVLQREALTTLAALATANPVRLLIAGAGSGCDLQSLAAALGIPVAAAAWRHADVLQQVASTGEVDEVLAATALGVTRCPEGLGQGANFRQDFMPHQGRRLRLAGAAKWASVSVSFLLLAVGLHQQLTWAHLRQQRQALRDKLAPDYKLVMAGRELADREDPTRRLGSLLRALKRNRGEASSDDASGTFERILRALNQGKQQKLQIEITKISITPKMVNITGAAPDTQQALAFSKALEDAGFDLDVFRYDATKTPVTFVATETTQARR